MELFRRRHGSQEEAEPHLKGSQQIKWLARLEREQENLRAAALCRKLDIKKELAGALGTLGVLLNVQGDVMAARPLLTESEILCRQLGSTWQLAYLLRQLGLIAWHQGNLAQAEAYTQEALALARELGDKSLIANTLQNLGYFASLQGDLKQAGACYREGLSLAQEIGNEVQMCWPLVGLASVAAAEGQPVRAARLFGAAEMRLDVKVLMNNIEHAEYERVVQSARAQLGEKAFAAAWAEGRAMTPEQILTAQEPEPLSEQLPRVPQAITTTKTSPTYPAGLTAREVEILRLVAQGLTDAQVAEELVISPRTVNWHLTAIYSKIQVSSRSAATRYAIEQHLV